MKRIAFALVGTLLIAGLSLAALKDQTYTGEITDSQCATMGSHAGMGKPAKDCTLACIQRGAKFVLFNAAAKTVYQLDDQRKPAQFAGVKGCCDWHSRRVDKDYSRYGDQICIVACFRGPELILARPHSRRSLSRRSSWAFAATMIVERLIATAPTLMGRSSPMRTKSPAATGMATRL